MKKLLLPLVLLFGCESDPRDPQTWIKKLSDPRESQNAISQLKRLSDPVAVGPLIEHFKKTKDQEALRALANFKDSRALPLFIEALSYTEDTFDNAAMAARALAEIGDKSAVDPLIVALQKPLPIKSRANVVKLEVVKALGKTHDRRAAIALGKVLVTPADEQDFFLNHAAANALAELGDEAAAPSLIRGLFMVGRGADLYPACRVALLSIGAPSVAPLIEALQRKHPELEADAKKYAYRPGVIVQKTAFVLGDLRDKSAVPALLAELARPAEGDSHRGVLFALGMIADPSTTKQIAAVMTNAKADFRERVSAAEALNLAGDAAALPLLLTTAQNGDILKDGQRYPDVRMAAALAYGRLGGAAEADAFAKLAASEKAIKPVTDEAATRLSVAKACKADVVCYEKELLAVDNNTLVRQEKAAFMLARLGKPALPALLKKVNTPEPVVRFAVLYGIARTGDASCAECKKALTDQIDIDRGKSNLAPLVDEMRAVIAELGHK